MKLLQRCRQIIVGRPLSRGDIAPSQDAISGARRALWIAFEGIAMAWVMVLSGAFSHASAWHVLGVGAMACAAMLCASILLMTAKLWWARRTSLVPGTGVVLWLVLTLACGAAVFASIGWPQGVGHVRRALHSILLGDFEGAVIAVFVVEMLSARYRRKLWQFSRSESQALLRRARGDGQR